jgi:hypothetical protein
MKTATLEWNGPLIIGQQLPTYKYEIDRLRQEGVYLWYREYTNGNLLAYVGKTGDIAKRFKEHLAQECFLQNNPRTSDGVPVGDNSDLTYFGLMMNFDKSIAIGKAEVQRTRFHYAFTTDIGKVEGYLIDRLKKRGVATAESSRRVLCCNEKGLKEYQIDTLNHTFWRLKELEEQSGTLAYILDAVQMPVDSCNGCLRKRWVCCECGASSNLGTPDAPPEKCPNYRCNLRKFSHVSFRVCCESHNHDLKTICEHCGKQDSEVVA